MNLIAGVSEGAAAQTQQGSSGCSHDVLRSGSQHNSFNIKHWRVEQLLSFLFCMRWGRRQKNKHRCLCSTLPKYIFIFNYIINIMRVAFVVRGRNRWQRLRFQQDINQQQLWFLLEKGLLCSSRVKMGAYNVVQNSVSTHRNCLESLRFVRHCTRQQHPTWTGLLESNTSLGPRSSLGFSWQILQRIL